MDEVIVFADQIAERFLIDLADHGNDHAVLDLHGHADVEGARMHDLIADQVASSVGFSAMARAKARRR
jgi:hypothetical protein